MKNYPDILKDCELFSGFSEDEISSVLNCLGSRIVEFDKGNDVFKILGCYKIGIVLSGNLANVCYDYQGNQNIIASYFPADIFGEALICSDFSDAMVNVVAAEKSRVMFIDYDRILTFCTDTCTYHVNLIKRMLLIVAGKNVNLNRKLKHITKRTIREKLMSYLTEQSAMSKSDSFVISYNRQELADYLSVDRSALSAELGKLRDDGMLEFNKNKFKLLI